MAAMAEAVVPHVLVVPFPALGHINPLVLLCRRLRSLGFVITFLNTGSNHKRVSENNIVSGDGFRFMSVRDDFMPKGRLGNNLQEFLNAFEGMREDVEKVLQELIEDKSLPPVSCIISDGFISWTQDVAKKFGICRVSLWTTSATWGVISLHLGEMHEQGLLPLGNSTQVIEFPPGVSFNAQDLPQTIHKTDPFDPDFKLRIQRNNILKDDAWVLVNTFRDLEPDAMVQLAAESSGFIDIGPLLPPEQTEDDVIFQHMSPWVEEMGCLEWLDKQETSSVLYISFGSLATLPLDQLKEFSVGLKQSECKFLWVIRLDSMDDEAQREEILELAKDEHRGKIISWAPQLKVLRHASTGAFLTHCGWNSTMEALSAGVPVLAWPCFAEQKMNSVMAVEHWKVGIYARRDENGLVEAKDVERTIREIMENGDRLRGRAKELEQAAKKCLGEGGTSHGNLVAFCEDMKNRSICFKTLN